MVFIGLALILVTLFCAVLVVQAIRKEKELRRMAQFLQVRKQEDNVRITAELRSRGLLELGQAINKELDDIQTERIILQRQQREFRRGLTGLSHDIRTPLTGVQGYIQLLRDEEDPDLRQHYRAGIKRRLEDLRYLLDQLFLYAQVSDADYNVECSKIDANAILSESLAAFYPEFKSRGWKPLVVLSDEVCMVDAHSDTLTRIFRNLISNALSHGLEAPSISQEKICFIFENRVAASQELEVDRLFDCFYTFVSESKSGLCGQGNIRKGSGLGLAIVSQLSQAINAKASATLVGDKLRVVVELRK